MKKTYTIGIHDSHLARIDELASRLETEGVTIQKVFRELGMITVVAAPDQEARLKAMEGVVLVEPEGTVGVAPPDSDIQ